MKTKIAYLIPNKIKRAYQIHNKITMGIFNLPCIVGVKKIFDEPVYELAYGVHDIKGEDVYFVPSGRWLCELEDNSWLVLTNEEYNELRLQHDTQG